MILLILKVLGIIVLAMLAAIGVLILAIMIRTAWLEEKKLKRIADAVDNMIREMEERHEQSDPDGEADQRPGCEMESGGEADGNSEVHPGGGPEI